jgi:hypothetical protein
MSSFDISLHCEDLSDCEVYSEWLAERMREERLETDWQEFWQEIRDESEHQDNIHRMMMDER